MNIAVRRWNTIFGVIAVALFGALAGTAFSLSGTGGASDDAQPTNKEGWPAQIASAADYIECVEASGLITAHVLPAEGRRTQRVRFQVPATEESKEEARVAAQEAFASCAAKFGRPSPGGAPSHVAEPDEEAINATLARLDECLDSGHAPNRPAEWPFAEYSIDPRFEGRLIEIEPDQRSLYAACALLVEAETGVRAPRPLLDGVDPLGDGPPFE